MTATLTLTLPHSTLAPVAVRVRGHDTADFARRVAMAIRLFAARKGVAPQAVEYELVRGRG